jgi:hypothetical protein
MSKEIESHTLPCHDLIVALRIACRDYFERHAKLQHRGFGVDELDARRITIIILTAALCESCINTWLALNLDDDCFSIIERVSPVEKWVKVPKLIIKNYKFPLGQVLYTDLKELFRCRDSIMHQKAEIKTSDGILHKGNHQCWESVDHNKIQKMINLPDSLLKHLAECHQEVSMMKSASAIYHYVQQYLPVNFRRPHKSQ